MNARASWRRPSPSMAVSLVALFVALSGTALALQRNSVGPRELKPDAVRAKHIKERNVRTGGLAGGAVTASKLDVVATARSTGPVDYSPPFEVPLTGKTTWTQQAGEVDLIVGEVRYELGNTSCLLALEIAHDPYPLRRFFYESSGDVRRVIPPADEGPMVLPAPNSAVQRTLKVTIGVFGPSPCGTSPEDVHIEHVRLQVIRVR